MLSDQEISACIHPRQGARLLLALIFAILLFPFIVLLAAAGTVALVVPIGAFFVWVGMRVYFANLFGKLILVSPLNYPRIHTLAEEIKADLGYHKKIYIFVFELGSFNAYLSKLFFRRAIFLTSEILEPGVSDEEVRWIVGRFVGYLVAQKRSNVAGWMVRVAERFLIFNFFILPYDRAMVYTGDRLALAIIKGDISTAVSAMQKLLVGRQMGYSVNPEGLVEQHRLVKGSVFAFLARLSSPFPHTTARYVDLIVFAKQHYPDQYANFAVANPGLPDDIVTLRA